MSKAVQQMFDSISPRYDLLNRFLSLRRDVVWRRRASLEAGSATKILDLCGGTGDLIQAWQQRWGKNNFAVIGDFSLQMLLQAAKKQIEVPLVQCDALTLPFAPQSFDLVLCAFGMRNFDNFHTALDEIHQVLQPEGRVVILEFFKPDNMLTRIFYGILAPLFIPVLGAFFSGRRSAYDYLVRSVRNFVTAVAFKEAALKRGFKNAKVIGLDGGIAHIIVLDRDE